ncbi:MAG: hypothetical protein JWN34_1089, partial [Bryobacterales bacterium]|nr:hypothetical protein [Bryobacterales bacterium]
MADGSEEAEPDRVQGSGIPMTRRNRVLSLTAAGVGGVVLLLVAGTLLVVQTDWFRQFVREKIITATSEATGGRVEVGSFQFDVSKMSAVITNFVIHGKEPAGEAPFVRVARVQVDLRLFTSFKHLLDLVYLGVERPQVNVLIAADGSTNLPGPRQTTKPESDTTALETIVNLAVGHFQLEDGLFVANGKAKEFEVRGNDLRAELYFNALRQSYSGELALQPLYVLSGRNTPVNFQVRLPVTLAKDRLDLRNASISTDSSRLVITGQLENLRDPRISGHVTGHVSLADAKNAGNLPLLLNVPNTPGVLNVDVNATAGNNTVEVTGANIEFGNSTIQASGPLKNPQGRGELQFKAGLAVDELGRLAGVAARPEGRLEMQGTARLDAANNYDVAGNLAGNNISFLQGGKRIGGVQIRSAMHLDPKKAELQGLRLNALGGEFLGNVSLADYRLYSVDGNLRNLDIQTLAKTFGGTELPYSGAVSGKVVASGDAQGEGTKTIRAQANLAITQGRGAIPVTGRLQANYNGAADAIAVTNSYVALPHTRLELNGALNSRLNVALTSTDLQDLLAAVPGEKPNVRLNGGQARFTGAVSGALANPTVSGRLAVDRFSVEGRAFQTLAADLDAARNGASIQNGILARGPMEARFNARVGLREWKALPQSPLTADFTLSGGDVADMVVLAGQPPAGYSGAITASAHLEGTVANPTGQADVQASAGTLHGEPFDQAKLHAVMADRLVTVPAAFLTSGPRRVDVSAEFQHPADSFKSGRVHARLKSNQIDLATVRNVQLQRPNTSGLVQLDADVTGELTDGPKGSDFMFTQVTANAAARNLTADGQNYGDATLAARTSGQTVSYDLTSNFAGSTSKVTGKTDLVRDYPTTADANISGLPIQRLLVLAKQSDVPARGDLSGTAHFRGTAANPQGNADLVLTNAVVYDEPLDRVQARVDIAANAVDLKQLEITQGQAKIALTGRFDHPVNDFKTGNVRFNVESTVIDLARIRNAQKLRPGLGGRFHIAANGAGTVVNAEPKLVLRSLNADVAATGLTVQKSQLGDLTLKANTTGNQVAFAMDSNFGGSAIQGRGNVQLNPQYPVDARVTFNNVSYNRLRVAMGPAAGGGDGAAAGFDVVTDGSVTMAGSVMKTEQLRGALELTRLHLDTLPGPGTKALSVRNEGPVRVAMENGVVRIENARLTGPQTDIQATGTASLPQKTLDVGLNANANLGILQSLSRDIVASGAITAAATVRGTFDKPLTNGQMELKNASFNHTSIPNGISNANGLIVFGGSNATIRTLTGETGGGKLTASGFVGYANGARFGLRTQASHVRYRVQQGVSAVGSADIRLTGTSASSSI